jgi:hypothetical protein
MNNDYNPVMGFIVGWTIQIGAALIVLAGLVLFVKFVWEVF